MRRIDADALKEALSIFNAGNPHFLNGIKTAREIIDDAPTIEAEPVRRGKWTTHRTLTHDGEWYCSACDYEPTVFENTPYCPNCGAKMETGD